LNAISLLLLFAVPPQGVEAVAIHGDKEQEERERSIDAFKKGEKDVLVATDVASKVSKPLLLLQFWLGTSQVHSHLF
jgi:hypothetical protein